LDVRAILDSVTIVEQVNSNENQENPRFRHQERQGRRPSPRRKSEPHEASMNSIDLKGRVAIVTGGARGIGFAITERMLASGASVAIWDVDQDALGRTATALSNKGKLFIAQVDVTSEHSIESAVASHMKHAGKIDILVNNAGITGGNAPTWELSPEVWRQVINVNLIGPYLVSRAVVTHMMTAKYGRIVNIASIAGKEGNPNASHYSASKAGVIGLTKSLAKELATSGVLVNCVTPAVAKTELFSQMTEQHINYMLSKIPMNRFVAVEEIAAMVAWLSSEDCSFSTGAAFDISGGRAVY
jgi:NAD(P)-dependent dehydrogenase (short-subunit alcohol dehydrogenase family)